MRWVGSPKYLDDKRMADLFGVERRTLDKNLPPALGVFVDTSYFYRQSQENWVPLVGLGRYNFEQKAQYKSIMHGSTRVSCMIVQENRA